MEPVFRWADHSRPSGEIGEAEGFIVDHLEKAGRATAIWDIGLEFCARGGQNNAGLRLDKACEIGPDPDLPEASFFHAP